MHLQQTPELLKSNFISAEVYEKLPAGVFQQYPPEADLEGDGL
jgi:hypothetical protein